MMDGRRFQFRPVLTICAALGLAALIGLGNWQLQRRTWKLDLIAKIEARLDAPPIAFAEAAARAGGGEDMEYTPVTLTGVYQYEFQEKIFGAIEGAPGVFVFAPMVPGAGKQVYVNRGFVPQGIAIGEGETAPAADRRVEATGLFRYAEQPSPPASWFLSTVESSDGLWSIRDPALLAASAGIAAAPYYIDSYAVEGAEWPKGGTTRLDFHNTHLDYAMTWFGLGAVLVGVWLVFSLPKAE